MAASPPGCFFVRGKSPFVDRERRHFGRFRQPQGERPRFGLPGNVGQFKRGRDIGAVFGRAKRYANG